MAIEVHFILGSESTEIAREEFRVGSLRMERRLVFLQVIVVTEWLCADLWIDLIRTQIIF